MYSVSFYSQSGERGERTGKGNTVIAKGRRKKEEGRRKKDEVIIARVSAIKIVLTVLAVAINQ
ncbi:MAG TPA: hypothetical protein VK211_07805 [Kamptonema sp.]|nr:hypothetical protein [Kamptonema sp.]